MPVQMLFDDMLVNASVARPDELRLSRQSCLLLRWFIWCRRKNRAVTTQDLVRVGGYQYGSRLFEIRRHLIPRGFCIDCAANPKGGPVHFYRMVARDESEWYAKRKDRL